MMSQRLGRFMLLVRAQSLNPQHRILRPAVSFFLDQQFLLPQCVVKRVTLLEGGVTEPLSVIHAVSIGKSLEQVSDLPFDLARRLLGPAAKVHVVLHLQAAKLVFQQRKFVIDCQSGRSSTSSSRAREVFRRNIPQPSLPSHVLKYRDFMAVFGRRSSLPLP